VTRLWSEAADEIAREFKQESCVCIAKDH